MVVDTLSLAGLATAVPYALLPLLFGREFLYVTDESAVETLPLQTATVTVHSGRAAEGSAQPATCG